MPAPPWPYTYCTETFYCMLHWRITTVYVLLVHLVTMKVTHLSPVTEKIMAVQT